MTDADETRTLVHAGKFFALAATDDEDVSDMLLLALRDIDDTTFALARSHIGGRADEQIRLIFELLRMGVATIAPEPTGVTIYQEITRTEI